VFYDYLRGREIVRFVAEMHGLAPRESERRCGELVERFELGEAMADYAVNYSRGMKKKLGLIVALVHDPDLLILDEPTNGLDPGGIQEFREMIRAMVEQEGRTVFISSHLLDEVEKICDHAAIVDRGKILMQGAIAELAEGSARHELIVGVDDPVRALEVLQASDWVLQAQRSDEGLRVILGEVPDMSDTESAAAVNAALVGAGLAVSRLEPVRQSLEKRFLEVTSRLSSSTTEEVMS